jgi:hypothetical protein
MLNDDLDNLKDRENRYVSLSDQCRKLEVRKNDTGDRYNTIVEQRDELKCTLESLNPYSLQYKETQQELKDWETRYFDSQVELRMLTFQFQLIQSDFLVELSARPDLIRFQVDIENRIEDTKRVIWDKSEEERDSEKRLTLLKTNCERMRMIMRKILHDKGAEGANKDDKHYKKKTTDEGNGSKPDITVGVEIEHGRQKEHRRSTLDKLNIDNKNKKNKHHKKELNKDKKHSDEHDKHKHADQEYLEYLENKARNEHQSVDKDGRYEDRSGWFKDNGGENGKNRHKDDHKADKDEDMEKRHLVKESMTSDDGNDADTDTPTPRVKSKIPNYQRNNAYRYDYHV